MARGLDGPAAGALREAARDSFVHGLHATLAVSAVLLLLGALAALRLPRRMECGAEGAAAGAAGSGKVPPPSAPLQLSGTGTGTGDRRRATVGR